VRFLRVRRSRRGKSPATERAIQAENPRKPARNSNQVPKKMFNELTSAKVTLEFTTPPSNATIE